MGRLLDPALRTQTYAARRARREERQNAIRRSAARTLFDDASTGSLDETELEETSEIEIVEEIPEAEDDAIGRMIYLQSESAEDVPYIATTSFDGTPQYVPLTNQNAVPWLWAARLYGGAAFSPRGVLVDDNRREIYVFGEYPGAAFRFAAFNDAGTLLEVRGAGTGLADPRDAALGTDGALWVSETGAVSRVSKIDRLGNWLSSIGSGGVLSQPRAIAVKRQGRDATQDLIYVADTLNNRVARAVASPGTFTTFIGSGSADGQVSYPHGIDVFQGSGHIVVADYGNNRVKRFTGAGTYQNDYAAPIDAPYNGPAFVAIDPDTLNVAVAELDGARILLFDQYGTPLGVFGRYGSGLSQFGQIRGLEWSSRYGLFVSDASRFGADRFSTPQSVSFHRHDFEDRGDGSVWEFTDDFIWSDSLRWTVAGNGNGAAQPGEEFHPGLYRLNSGNANGNSERLYTNQANIGKNFGRIRAIVRFNSSASVRYRFGLMDSSTPANGVFWEFDTSTFNDWRLVVMSGGVATRYEEFPALSVAPLLPGTYAFDIDLNSDGSGVARIASVSGGFLGQWGSVGFTGAPVGFSTPLFALFGVYTLNNNGKTMDIDWFYARIVEQMRAGL